MRMLLFLFACAAPDLEIVPSQEYCTDYNFEDPAPSEVLHEWEGDAVRVWRTNVLVPANLTFDPDLVPESKILHVYENWVGEQPEEDLCYFPTITITGIEKTLEVRWYEMGYDDVPVSTITIEAP